MKQAALVCHLLITAQLNVAAQPQQNALAPDGPQSKGWQDASSGHYSAPPRNWYRYNQPPQYDSGDPTANPYGQYGSRHYGEPYNHIFPQAVAGYAPPGLVLPLILVTSLSSRGARDGDPVRATIARNTPLEGNAYIPSGAIVSGHVTEVKRNGFLEHQGSLSIEFNELTLPDGRKFPISAHLLGGLGDVGYGDLSYSDTHGSLSARQRMENMGVTSELGTAGEGGIGLAAAPVYGANFARGLGSATSIVGAADVLGNLFRRGKNVIIASGMRFEIQLDSPLRIGPADQSPPPPAPTRSESGF
jgi:hypothetical protein